jgi:hypothetical protein
MAQGREHAGNQDKITEGSSNPCNLWAIFDIIIIVTKRMKTKKTDFYITYHPSDEMAARWIAAVLKQVRFSTLSDSWDFLPGEAANEKIEYMFTAGRNVMVLISDSLLKSLSEIESWQAVPTTMIKSCLAPSLLKPGNIRHREHIPYRLHEDHPHDCWSNSHAHGSSFRQVRNQESRQLRQSHRR